LRRGSFPQLIEHGAAFGVPYGDGFASLAWTFDESARFDSIGIFTVPKFRRLGLARASATALMGHIVYRRKKSPLWSTTAENPASQKLAFRSGSG